LRDLLLPYVDLRAIPRYREDGSQHDLPVHTHMKCCRTCSGGNAMLGLGSVCAQHHGTFSIDGPGSPGGMAHLPIPRNSSGRLHGHSVSVRTDAGSAEVDTGSKCSFGLVQPLLQRLLRAFETRIAQIADEKRGVMTSWNHLRVVASTDGQMRVQESNELRDRVHSLVIQNRWR